MRLDSNAHTFVANAIKPHGHFFVGNPVARYSRLTLSYMSARHLGPDLLGF